MDQFKTNGIKQMRVHKWFLFHFDIFVGDTEALIDCSVADLLDLSVVLHSDETKLLR